MSRSIKFVILSCRIQVGSVIMDGFLTSIDGNDIATVKIGPPSKIKAHPPF